MEYIVRSGIPGDLAECGVWRGGSVMMMALALRRFGGVGRRHELVHLYPRLAAGGVLIIDDYGHWRGARQATDEYFLQTRDKVPLNRIDNTGRIGIKPT